MVVRRIRIKGGASFVFSRFAAGVVWLSDMRTGGGLSLELVRPFGPGVVWHAGMRTGGALEKLGVRNEE